MSLVKIKHTVTPNKESTDALFMELIATLTVVYDSDEEQAVAIAPLKEKYDALFCNLASEAFKKGKKMSNADFKDNEMYN